MLEFSTLRTRVPALTRTMHSRAGHSDARRRTLIHGCAGLPVMRSNLAISSGVMACTAVGYTVTSAKDISAAAQAFAVATAMARVVVAKSAAGAVQQR
eukprot:6197293-Pleurochrysis_carterae.AAC.3